MDKISVLVVNDDLAVRECLIQILENEGYDVHDAKDNVEAMERLKKKDYQLVTTDLRHPGPKPDGIELLKHIREKYPQTQVVIIAGYIVIEEVVEAMKLGAFDFITKPPKGGIPELRRRVFDALEPKSCPKCNRRIQSDWQYCPYDGTNIA